MHLCQQSGLEVAGAHRGGVGGAVASRGDCRTVPKEPLRQQQEAVLCVCVCGLGGGSRLLVVGLGVGGTCKVGCSSLRGDVWMLLFPVADAGRVADRGLLKCPISSQ